MGQSRGRSVSWTLKTLRRRKWKKPQNKQIDKLKYRVAHQQHQRFLWFPHWKGTGVCPPSAAAKRTHTKHIMILVAITMWYWYIKKLSKNIKNNYKQAPAECRPSISVSHWALRSLPSLWWPGSSWPALKKRARVKITSTGHSCLNTVLPYICFLVADHSRPPLAWWQIEVHCVPADTISEPGWSENRPRDIYYANITVFILYDCNSFPQTVKCDVYTMLSRIVVVRIVRIVSAAPLQFKSLFQTELNA